MIKESHEEYIQNRITDLYLEEHKKKRKDGWMDEVIPAVIGAYMAAMLFAAAYGIYEKVTHADKNPSKIEKIVSGELYKK